MFKTAETRWGTLMANLIYPAFLGSAFVWFFTKIASDLTQTSIKWQDLFSMQNLYGLWFIMYFCIAFIITYTFKIEKPYGIIAFLLDIGDVLVLFSAYLNLGFIIPTNVNWSYLYCTIAAIPIVAFLTNLNFHRPIKWGLSIPAFISSVLMAIWGYNYSWLNWSALALFTVLLLMYFGDFSKRTPDA